MAKSNNIGRIILNKFTGYFLKGLILIVPITLTVYIVYQVFAFFDNLLPYEIPGISLLIVLIGTTFLGFIGTTFIQVPIAQLVEKTLNKVPLVKFIYTSIKELLSAFVGNEKRFTKPVMVKTNRDTEMYKLGFITQDDLSNIGIKEGKSAVYLPHSYNFSGNLFIVSNDLISPVEAKSDDVMKFIVSGGVTKI